MNSGFLALVLAAGKGTRFKSDTAKVLHPILGKSMLRIVVEELTALHPEEIIIVVGKQKERIMEESFPAFVKYVVQAEQRGTADAVSSARELLKTAGSKNVMVINGDLPLIQKETLYPFLEAHVRQKADLTFLTASLDDPRGFGRIVRAENGGLCIVEEKDAGPEIKNIRECNLGVYLFNASALLEALPLITNDNIKREYYLTDIVKIMLGLNRRVFPFCSDESGDFVGVNNRYELARAADILRRRKIQSAADEGVSVMDPGSTWIDLNVRLDPDVQIYPSVVIEGNSHIMEGAVLFPGTHIVGSRIGRNARIGNGTRLDRCTIGDGAHIAAFLHLSDKTVMAGMKIRGDGKQKEKSDGC